MIGIDAVSISRIEKMTERFGEQALKRFLSQEEIALVRHPRTAAGFWCVKEAVSKALGCGIGADLTFHQIRIAKTPKGMPYATLAPEAAARHGVEAFAVSITHDGDLAIAVAIPR